VFFLSLAFSRGWITEPMRVLIGLGVGAAALAAGTVFLARASSLLGNVLTGVGLGVISIALFAATRLYGLVPAEVGLAGALAAAVAAAAIAIAYDARSVALFGLVSALVAPPLVGAAPTLLTLLFLAIVVVATTVISVYRTWPWLPQVAFLLVAPQLASWLLGDPDPAQAAVAVVGFWLVNALAAAGEEVRIVRDDLRPSSATLVLANAAFLVWGLLVLFGGEPRVAGIAVALASVAHLVLGAWFLARQGWEHLFGNLVAGTGVALLGLAAFLALDAAAVPVAWAAESVALTWLAVRRLHRWSALAALALGGLAAIHLLVVEYPVSAAGLPPEFDYPAPVDPQTITLVAVLLAVACAAVLVPVRWVRSSLVAAGMLLLAWAAPFEAAGTALVGLLVVIATGGLVTDRALARTRDASRVRDALPSQPVERVASLAAIGPLALGLAVILVTELPPSALGSPATSPFLNAAFASLVVLLVGFVAAGALTPLRVVRSALVCLGVLLLAWGLPFQVDGVPLVAGLAILLPVAAALELGLDRLPDAPPSVTRGWSPAIDRLGTGGGVVAWSAGAALVAFWMAPAWSWGSVTPPEVPFLDEAGAAGAALVGSVLLAIPMLGTPGTRRAAALAAVLAAAWIVPVEAYADGVVVLWVALAAVAVPATRVDPGGIRAWTGLAVGLWTAGLIVAIGVVAPPARLWVSEVALEDPSLLPGWPLAFAALAAGAWTAPRLAPLARRRRLLEAVAGLITLYGVSIAIVDLFVRQAGGPVPVEELAKQAQVALSVCWTAIGAVTLAIGFARRVPRLRHAGFALLGVATAKVFLVDLAAMDVAYRALVLFGLGLLLLASAWIATRSRGPRPDQETIAGGDGQAG
jgi:hypothetical protein